MISLNKAIDLINELNVSLDKFSIKDFMIGYNIELEHGTVNPKTNVTNDDPVMTAKIALAHLYEYPDYYNEEYGLPAMERYLETKNNKKINYILINNS